MITKFKLKADAEAFCRELEDRYGVGVYHHLYKGHRHWCVRHNDENTVILPDVDWKFQNDNQN